MTCRHVDYRYFFIALVPICIFAQEATITGHFFTADLPVPVDILTDGPPWLESAGRFRFVAATWFFCALVLLMVVLLARELLQPITRATRMAALCVLAIIVAVAMTPTLVGLFDLDATRAYDHLGADLFETALARGALPGCQTADDRWLLGACGDNPVLSMFNQVINVINIFAGLGVGALIVGMILCLETCKSDSHADQTALLHHNLQRMRRQLYLSGLLLSFGMLFATSWMHWPMPMVGGAEGDAYRIIVRAYSLFVGVYFCLLILSFYLPVVMILDSRVRHLAEEAAKSDQTGQFFDAAKWKAANGLATDPTEVLRSGFALVAPILAAFAGGISPLTL